MLTISYGRFTTLPSLPPLCCFIESCLLSAKHSVQVCWDHGEGDGVWSSVEGSEGFDGGGSEETGIAPARWNTKKMTYSQFFF